jgi:hypothetical protein
MEFEEQSLRNVLSSISGGVAGERILERAKNGEAVIIAMTDGATITLSDAAEVLHALLERFDWKRRIDWSDDRTAVYVLGICQRVERSFTLKEIVARVREERPEVILAFASAWGRLIQHKFIRIIRPGDPSYYEVSQAHQWP